MKKLIYIAAIILMSAAAASAQHISFVASWGSYQPWNVPAYVSDVVYYRYSDYDWVHTRRVVRNGQLSFRVVLQHGPQFMEVTMNRFGHVRRVRHYDYYPLQNHVCSSVCGYHEFYYNSFSNVCHSGHHHGHNHVTYRPRPASYVWGHYYDYPSHVKIYKKSKYKYYDHHGPKHHVHKQKGHKHKTDYHNNTNRRPDPIVVNQSRDRRQGTMRELEEDRQRRSREGKRSGERTYRSRRVN
jgi:hypothetical protein